MQIFRFTVWSDRPPPGAALMNLRYRNERAPLSKPKASSIVTVFLPDWMISCIARVDVAAEHVPAVFCVPQDADSA